MTQEKEPDTLFHYCSTSTFLSIISNRSVRLSSLSLSNDSMEGRLVIDTCRELLISSSINLKVHPYIISSIELCQQIFDSLGFCLSEEGDLLSQWRGYADDAQGFSIGFNSSYLDEMCRISQEMSPPIDLEKVAYTNDKHKEFLSPLIEKIAGNLSGESSLSPGRESVVSDSKFNDFIDSVLDQISNLSDLYSRSFKLKGYGFHEEREWRLISHLPKHRYDFVDFSASPNCIIPFRSVELKEAEKAIIDKVYLGPKNITPVYIVEQFLKSNGFNGVEVVRSSATYR